MADNPYKRGVANRAMAILNAGMTAAAGVFFTSITDAEFADYTTVSEQNYPDKRLICALYEGTLKQVLEELMPDFAKRYADLGQPHKVDKEFGGWDYLFELPSDFLALLAQVDESNPQRKAYYDRDPEVLHFRSYSHVVAGTDSQAYYCFTSHTSVDNAYDGQPPDNDGNENWVLYSADGGLGANWAESVSYKASATGKMLATNSLNDDAGQSAYIQYLAYTQAGQSDEPQYYPSNFTNALATRLAAEIALDGKDYERRRRLLEEYEIIAKPAYRQVQGRHLSRGRRLSVFQRRTGDYYDSDYERRY